eukprot:CAMPEP_0117438120 /NCGR_PEP_ID=MMETSP0759-20121206/1887_1 /TAXON_ID=63605 /ORGANISM="Percolomonas cosmopolitus, Strain WS" /LENGTH=220 /DNA_ID=CAMNT_0005229797 /DNA_START=51 /DNA_END=713 /DNA_ORIENTATION=+
MAYGYAKRKASDSEEDAPPKRPQTAFFLFSKDKRASLVGQAKFKTAEGKQDTKAITRELGRLWKGLDDDEKTEYNDKAKQLKEKWDADMEQYKEDHPDFRPTKKTKKATKGKAAKGKKAKKDPNAPKRPPSGYQIFCNEHRAEVNKRDDVKRENGKLDVTKVMKILSQMWKELDDEEKKPYLEQAVEKKEDYKKEKAAYDENKEASDEDEEEGSEEEESD